MKTWLPKKNIFYSSLAFLAISFLVYLMMVIAVKGKISQMESLYTASESKFFQEERRSAIDRIMSENSGLIEAVRKFFVAKGDEVAFIEAIENLARNNSLDFEIASISQSPQSEGSKEDIVVKMNLEGSWSKMASFIDKLESLPLNVSVRSLELDARSGAIWSGTVELVVFREK